MSLPPRKYSVDEIDRMRTAVSRRLQPKIDVDVGPYVDIKSLFPSSAQIEDRLRTYMLNGTAPEELEG